jgi:hypothetical protein
MRDIFRIAPLFTLLLALLAGCSTTPQASRESDTDAKRFEPALRSALIYLYRPDFSGGVATVWVDDRLVGQTVAGTYFRVVVRPGRNRITIGGNDTGRIEIDTREEGVYFVEIRVLGEGEGSHMTVFRSVPPETGKQVLLQCCTLLENWRPGQSRLGIFGI